MPEPARFVDFPAEVAEYDRRATVRTWSGPRHRLTARILGEGPALVLLPGLASTYRGHAPALHRLSRRFQTIQIDYPGENPGDGARLEEISHDHLVADLFDLMDVLDLASARLFGLSFGSTIALKALDSAPGRFPGAILQGGFARRRLMTAERLALALGRKIPGNTSRLPFHRLGLALNNRPTFPIDRPDLWEFYVSENGRTPIASLSHRLDLLDRLDLRPILPKIHQPVLSIHGTADRIVPMNCHRELVEGLENATSSLMVGVGHQPHWTHPDDLARLVGDFLDRAPPVWE